ncbi:MAG: cellulose biosynthesis cyclic di-GMP-binding regulatory protein BcsB [Spirulina sp.]
MSFLRRLGRWRSLGLVILGLGCAVILGLSGLSPSHAQSGNAVEQQEDAVIQQHSLPRTTPPAPVVRPAPRPAAPAPARPASPPASRPGSNSQPAPTPPNPSGPPPADPPANAPANPPETPDPEATPPALAGPQSQYVLQFNRSPVVGNALQMQGVLSQARIGFTRPRHWQVESAKVIIRFRHSPALYANRSNLTVRFNNRHLGSVPLNREDEAIGNVAFNIPTDLIQDFNNVIMEVQQHTSPTCTDPTDPTLWTEILPDSKVILDYRPQAIALDLSNYPYPFLDRLGLDPDRLTYLLPNTVDTPWLTASGRYQAAASRLSNGRAIQTRLVKQLNQVAEGQRLVVIGTPAQQPALAELTLPFAIENNQVLDGNGNPLPNGVGVLMLTTTPNGSTPVLVITGNDSPAVLKATQALAQPADQQLLTGQAALVNAVAEVSAPAPMDWPGYLPEGVKRLRLSDLEIAPNQLFQDVTVNGSPVPPPVEIPLRILPNEQVLRGSTFTLRYSYSPGIDPKRSSVSIMLDGQGIGGERLRSRNGGNDSVTVTVPPELVTPNSVLAMQFYTFPDSPISCGVLPDQPMWGSVHGNSALNLNRSNIIQLTDLNNLKTGFPLVAPQDLSDLALALPNQPSESDVATMLAVSDRMGRLSRGQSVKLGAYTADTIPNEARERNLVGIGLRDNFPIPEVFQAVEGFSLGEQLSRQNNQSQFQTLPDQAGVIQAQASPWNRERMLLGLSAQTTAGLGEIQQMFQQDALFARLNGDTVIVQRTTPNPSVYNQTDYQVVALSQRPPQTLDRRSLGGRIVTFMQRNWFLLPGGLVALVLLLYGLSQLYLNRLSRPEGSQ